MSDSHTRTTQRGSQEKRDGLELYSLFIAMPPFIWGLVPVYIALAIVSVNYGVIASKHTNGFGMKVNKKRRQ